MIEENQHPILYWHGETGKTFFPDMYSLKDLLWLSLPELAEWQRLLVLRLPFQSVKFQSDNCKIKGWCPCLQTPSSWAKLQKEWILHIVHIGYLHRICVLLVCGFLVFWMSECNVTLALSVREREMEIVVHICYILYTPYARGLLRPRTCRLARGPCFGCRGGAGGGSWGNRPEDFTSTSVCGEFKTQWECSSMKQHSEATKRVSAQRGLTWLQNTVLQLARKAAGWPTLMLGPNLRAAV